MLRNFMLVVLFLILAGFPASSARAQLLNDPLQGSTTGFREGGTFVPGGWRVDNEYNCIYWHVPTVSHGAFEYDIVGIPSACTVKNELSHMYDYTVGNADINYGGGYRDGPYKQFLRRQCDPGKVNTMEILWLINPNYLEDDTGPLTWDPGTVYHFRLEWENVGPNSTAKTYRNGTLVWSQIIPGSWNPAGQSVRIAASPRRASEGAVVGAIYSNVKVTDLNAPLTEVSIDLGSPEIPNGLTNLQGGDGDTTVDNIGGRSCRRNINPAEDFYFYFAAADNFAFQASKQDLYIRFDYYDTGTGSLVLQYDSNTGSDLPAFYKIGGSVALTNTNTWKRSTFHVTDAYFGNRENGGADFRIAGNTGATTYLDVVRVLTQVGTPPAIANVTPDPDPGHVGQPYRKQLTLTEGSVPITWSLTQAPPGAQINAGGLVTGWTPAQADFEQLLSFTAKAVNAEGEATESWQVLVLSRADFDGDHDSDQADFGHLQSCLSGTGLPYPPGCADADLTGDGSVDSNDFIQFAACLGGPNLPPGC